MPFSVAYLAATFMAMLHSDCHHGTYSLIFHFHTHHFHREVNLPISMFLD